MNCYYKCSVALPRDAMGWSAVCDCGISWSYSLTFLWKDNSPLWFNNFSFCTTDNNIHYSLPGIEILIAARLSCVGDFIGCIGTHVYCRQVTSSLWQSYVIMLCGTQCDIIWWRSFDISNGVFTWYSQILYSKQCWPWQYCSAGHICMVLCKPL